MLYILPEVIQARPEDTERLRRKTSGKGIDARALSPPGSEAQRFLQPLERRHLHL